LPDYALFLGCMIPLRLPYMESSAKQLLGRFDINLVEMPDTGCCPDPSLKSLDHETWTALAARNLAIAEDMDLDILTLCNGCFETLKTVRTVLKDEKLRAETNDRLAAVGREYQGRAEVKHLVEVLVDDIGLKRLGETVVTPIHGLRVAAHYGCHLLRPSSILGVDDPMRPVLLDALVELTGAHSVPYYKKNLCCGAGVSGVDAETGKGLVRYKLDKVKRARADCLTVVCPFCMLQYDVTQTLVRDSAGERFNIPVFYLPELLLLSMGVEAEDLAFEMHRTKTNSVVEMIQGGS